MGRPPLLTLETIAPLSGDPIANLPAIASCPALAGERGAAASSPRPGTRSGIDR